MTSGTVASSQLIHLQEKLDFFLLNVKLEEQRVWSQKCLYPCQHKDEVLSLRPVSSSIVLSIELACSNQEETYLKMDKVVVIILSQERELHREFFMESLVVATPKQLQARFNSMQKQEELERP